ncbi:MAG: carboxypeptidase-like regulatory domain-containing protein, partial [Chitinophagaceae bacterium]
MKFTAILIFAITFQVFAKNGHSQNVSFEMNNVSLKKVFKEIQKQTGYYFLYSVELLEQADKVNLNIQNATVEAVMSKCLENTELSYAILEKTIVIKKMPVHLKIPTNEEVILPPVNGVVLDVAGKPLQGVSVLIKGTKVGTTTDANGSFELNVPENGSQILVFSFIGMEDQEVDITTNKNIQIKLKIKNDNSQNGVGIGYGSVKKSDLTGAVSSINAKDIGDRQVSDIGSLIQGRASGVDVTGGKIRIRGVTTFNNTDPLVVIDGFLGGNVATVNPNDIANIEILKDASATAIYGARGANGVILITTKGGKAGPLKVSVNAFYGISAVPKKLPVLNSSQYIDYLTDVLGNAGQSLTPELMDPNRRKDVTFWQDEVYQNGNTMEFDVDFSGGTEKAHYYFSMGYQQNESIVIGPKANTFFARNKNDFKLAKWLRVGNNFAFNFSAAKGTQPWDTRGMIGMPPYYGVYDSTNLGGYTNVNRSTDLTDVYNPIPLSKLSFPESSSLGYQTNLWAEVEPIKGLIYRLQAGISGHFGRTKSWNDEYINGGTQYNQNGVSEGSSYSFLPLIENT